MVDLKVLNDPKYGSDFVAIKAVCTAGPPQSDTESKVTPPPVKLNSAGKVIFDRRKTQKEKALGKPLTKKEANALREEVANDLWKSRQTMEKKLDSRVQEGIMFNVRNARFYIAADMAWDSSPIIPEQIPLDLYAKGKIDLKTCASDLLTLQDKFATGEGQKFLDIDPETKEPKGVNVARLYEVVFNVVRPYMTRRVAGQVNKYNNRDVHLEYVSRDRNLVGKLRADVMSQRAEIMWDQFGYGHQLPQVIREMLLYSHVVSFVESAWEKDKQIHLDDDGGFQDVIEREGVDWVTPHPTRVFYDLEYPLSTLNYNKGCRWIGHWSLTRLSEVRDNPSFFNKNDIPYGKGVATVRDKHPIFTQYYLLTETTALKFPNENSDYFERNERNGNIGIYSSKAGDAGVMLTNYYERVIPKDIGIGNYPHPVWMRLVIVNDKTVVYGEFLPSLPAIYMGYNENDSKLLSVSMAHEMIPFQDQIQQLLGQMVYLMKIQSILIFVANSDIVDKETLEKVKLMVEGKKIFQLAQWLELSFADKKELLQAGPGNSEALKAFQIITAPMQSQINELLKGIGTLSTMLEKHLMMSQQELGQIVGSGEASASEVLQVADATTSLYNFISQPVDEYQAAMRKVIYESTVVLGSEKIKVPVVGKYPVRVVREAGFTPAGDVQDDKVQTVIGTKRKLVHDYIYDTRSGSSEKHRNIESGKVLMQLVTMLIQDEYFKRRFGLDQIAEAVTETFRMVGSDFNLKLEEGGEDEAMQSPEEMVQQIGGMLMQQLEPRIEKLEGNQAELANRLADFIEGAQQQVASGLMA